MSKDFVVVKFGSELVTTNEGLNHTAINHYATSLLELHRDDSLIVVTSGAVAVGRCREEEKGKDVSNYDNATFAQLGHSIVTHGWEVGFDYIGVSAGGLLVTHHELDDTNEGSHFKAALDYARERDVISIVNANDALSNEEKMKDNDWLASHIARTVGAKSLTLYTKKGGVTDDAGILIDCIDQSMITEVRSMLCGRQSRKKSPGDGRGGIAEKVDAAWVCAQAGIVTRIAAPNEDMTGDRVTRFMVG